VRQVADVLVGRVVDGFMGPVHADIRCAVIGVDLRMQFREVLDEALQGFALRA